MGKYSRAEIMAAFDRYNEARIAAQESGDWSIWARMFREDAHYIEHAYGEFDGRAEIEKWICDVMAPFPELTSRVVLSSSFWAASSFDFSCRA